MKIKILFLLLITLNVFSQKDLSSLLISEELKEKANSVVRFQKIEVIIQSQKSYKVTTKKAITVLNEYGLKNIEAREYYSKSDKINSIEATIYDPFGKELKKIRRKDFIDHSVADGFSILSDNRVLYLDYTPTQYPFTIVYESETESINTAFLPSWYPIDDYYESIEKSEFTIKYPSGLGFKYKEQNFENFNIIKKEENNLLIFSVENLMAQKPEDYAPTFKKTVPNVIFGLEKFSLEGVEGVGNSWEEFSLWMYQNLLKDTEVIPEETIKTIKSLVGETKDPIGKAKIVYKYVQDKCRYVSVQLGIGGWKPMLVSEVDRLGYGDCKALSNYTRVLLKIVGVESYYTIIYAGNEKESIDKDFVSIQGNHVILTLPIENGYAFLECTSQISPFGYNGDFTDDRFALIVKPNGGEIIRTNEYNNKKSLQSLTGKCIIDVSGNMKGEVKIISKGIQYDNIYPLERQSSDEIDKHYKSYFSWLPKLKINKFKFNNDKEKIEFIEDLEISSINYTTVNNELMMFSLNVFNRNTNIPQRYRNRLNPFEIDRGFYDVDEVEVNFPSCFVIDAKPENIAIISKFGTYNVELILINDTKLIYKRSLLINKGTYDKSEYDDFRDFKEQIARGDNSKIVLKVK